MSRRWPGASPTMTSRAPALRNARAAPATTAGWVLIAVPSSVLDEIRLEEHAQPLDLRTKHDQTAMDHIRKVRRVIGRRKQSNG